MLTWSPAVKAPSGKNYVINGYVGDDNFVQRVETWVGDNIMGDMHVLVTYTGWKDFGGVMAPSKIVQTRGGWPFFEADVTAAQANPADLATSGSRTGRARRRSVPAPGGRGGPAAPPAPAALTVTTEKLGDGVYRLTTGTGSYDSLIVDFRDHILMLEAGQNEARSLAYIAEAKKLIPNKPIRYVMNTHAHADHTGGLPAMVAEGATIITQKNNETFFDRALNTPRTLLNDRLAKNPSKVKVESVSGQERSIRMEREGSRCTTSTPRRTRTGCWSPTSRRKRCCFREISPYLPPDSRPTITSRRWSRRSRSSIWISTAISTCTRPRRRRRKRTSGKPSGSRAGNRPLMGRSCSFKPGRIDGCG